jgi:hypothetical protein
MDSIDITDSTFSLDVPDLNEFSDSIGSVMNSDYTMYIYIGVAIVVVVLGMFVFHKFMNKQKDLNNNDNDCPGGFCTLNNSSRQL